MQSSREVPTPISRTMSGPTKRGLDKTTERGEAMKSQARIENYRQIALVLPVAVLLTAMQK